MNSRTLGTLLLGVILGLFLGFLLFNQSISDDSDFNALLPDYSQINVVKTINRITIEGNGSLIDEISTLKISYQVWIYNPTRSENRGKIIFESGQNLLSTTLNHNHPLKKLIKQRRGVHLQQIIPYGHPVFGEGKLFEIPHNAILLTQVRVNNDN